MEKTRTCLCELIGKVDIYYKGKAISNEVVLKIEEQFMTEAFADNNSHVFYDGDMVGLL